MTWSVRALLASLPAYLMKCVWIAFFPFWPLRTMWSHSEQRPRPLSIQQRYQQWWTDEPTMNQQRTCHWFSVMTHIQPTANALWKSLDNSRSIQLCLPCIIMKQHQAIRIITISGHLVDLDCTMNRQFIIHTSWLQPFHDESWMSQRWNQ